LTDTNGSYSDDDDRDENDEESLFEQLALTLAQEYCQGQENTTIRNLNITRTFPGTINRNSFSVDLSIHYCN
jgi:hypothetical protein